MLVYFELYQSSSRGRSAYAADCVSWSPDMAIYLLIELQNELINRFERF